MNISLRGNKEYRRSVYSLSECMRRDAAMVNEVLERRVVDRS